MHCIYEVAPSELRYIINGEICNLLIENAFDILHDWHIWKSTAPACSWNNIVCGSFSLSATCGVSESIIGAEEGCKGAGDGVAVGGDRGGRRHPVVQDPLLSPILLLVLLQGVGLNLHLQKWDPCQKVSDLAPFGWMSSWFQSKSGHNRTKVDKIGQHWTKGDKIGQKWIQKSYWIQHLPTWLDLLRVGSKPPKVKFPLCDGSLSSAAVAKVSEIDSSQMAR